MASVYEDELEDNPDRYRDAEYQRTVSKATEIYRKEIKLMSKSNSTSLNIKYRCSLGAVRHDYSMTRICDLGY